MPVKNRTIKIDHLGQEYNSMAEMLRKYNINYSAFLYRLDILGMTLEEALTAPKRENLSTAIACTDHCGNSFQTKADMCDFWRIPRTTFFRRIRNKWDLEKALTTPVNHNHEVQKRQIKDHKGNTYYSVDEMCNAYGITKRQYIINIRNNCSIKEALTTVTKWTVCRDHLGNVYKSINEMCSHYGITKTTLRSRLELGWTLREVLENPQKKTPGQKHKDHLGNVYKTQKDMLDHYGISHVKFTHRKKHGHTLEECLQKDALNLRTCTDHKGNTFRMLKDMMLYWNTSVSSFHSKINKGQSVEQALTSIGKRKTLTFGPDIESIKNIGNHYYEIRMNGENMVWHIDTLMDYYRRTCLPNNGKDLILKTAT